MTTQDDLTFVRWLQSGSDQVPELADSILAAVAPEIAPLQGAERVIACEQALYRLDGEGPATWGRLRDAMEEIDASQEDEPQWQILTLADAYKERDPLVYAVDGLFSLPSLSIAYGAPGVFKSFLMADMCACVAGGLPWLAPLPGKAEVAAIPTRQMPAFWCDFDNGRRRTDERFDALGKAYELPEDTPLYYVSMPDPWLDMGALGAVRFMVRTIRDLGARLVVIDNLGNISGKADENSADMVHVLSAFRRIAEESGAAIVLIHHQRKSTGYNTRAGESLRGHSSIEAAIDLALLVEREEHAETAQMKSTKVRGADVLPFGAMFTYDHMPGTDELESARFFGWPIEDVVSDAAIDRAAFEVLDGDECNKGKLATEIKGRLPDVGLNRIRNRVDWLASEGKLAMKVGDRGAKLYSLPSKAE